MGRNRITRGRALIAQGEVYSQVPIIFKKSIDMSGGGTATETAVLTVPAGSIILNVMTHCTAALDGDTTKTVEVGLTANTDKYIDPIDAPVTLNGFMDIQAGTNQDQKGAEFCAAAQAIVATWTNTANATAGAVDVYVMYIPKANVRAQT